MASTRGTIGGDRGGRASRGTASVDGLDPGAARRRRPGRRTQPRRFPIGRGTDRSECDNGGSRRRGPLFNSEISAGGSLRTASRLPRNRQRTGFGAVPRPLGTAKYQRAARSEQRARCLRTGKEQAPGPFPGARSDRSIVSPSHPGGPSWRKCGVLVERQSGPAPRRGSLSRASTRG